MEQAIQHGADIIIRDWVRLRAGERILIVSSQKYAVEVAAMQQAAQAVGSVADVLMLDDLHEQVGQYFDDREDAFDPYNAVIGAAEYSLITTRAVKRVIARRNRFLSLPLSTSNGQSLLSYDFLNMSLPKSRIMASIIMACYQNASHIHVTTELGTNLDFNIEGRVPGFFNGCCHDGKGLSSASVEVYVAPVESDTNGTLILDGSMGYIGIVDSPVRVELRAAASWRSRTMPAAGGSSSFWPASTTRRTWWWRRSSASGSTPTPAVQATATSRTNPPMAPSTSGSGATSRWAVCRMLPAITIWSPTLPASMWTTA